MSENVSQAEKLIQEGIQAIKSGDKALGRGKLEAAVQIDERSETAWLWLARVVETIEEKRTCLGNVIIINPQNEQAQNMLAQLEGRAIEASEAEKATIGGASPRTVLIGALVGLVVCGVIGALGMFVLGGEETQLPTLIPPTATVTNTLSAEQIEGSQTPTPSPSFTPTSNATWTPTSAPPTATPLAIFTPLPDEFSADGRLVLQSGRVVGDENNQPIAIIQMSNPSNVIQVSGEGQRGQNAALVPNQNRFAWAQYQSGTRSLTLQIQSFGVAESLNVMSLMNPESQQGSPLNAINYPNWYENQLVFSAQQLGSPAQDLWLLEVSAAAQATPLPSFGDEPTLTPTPLPPTLTATPDPNAAAEEGDASEAVEAVEDTQVQPEPTPTIVTQALVRLTNDDSNNFWPDFEPNTGNAVVYVAVSSDGVTDLRVINIETLQITALTSNENLLIETAPDWSSGNEVVFSGTALGSETSDIYIMDASQPDVEPELLIDYGEQDIRPRFSPDGRYIAFTSNINDNWDVFIYDREADMVYSLLTDADSIDVVNDWTD